MRHLIDFSGRRIRLTDERLVHIMEHSEMAGGESRIDETLADPDTVVQSRSDPQVHMYYRHYRGTVVGSKWLCVVVKALAVDAFIITAYLTDRIKQGTTLWQRTQ